MSVHPYDVCIIEKFILRSSKKDRTAVTVAVVGEDLYVFPTSSRVDLCEDDPSAFLISSDDLDFPATGLACTSYVLDRPAAIHISRVRKVIGKLTGDLKRRFIEHFALD